MTEQTIRCNQYIAIYQEVDMYCPLCGMIDNGACMIRSNHRLYKFHLLTKEWLNKVICGVKGDDCITIFNNLLSMLHNFFDYVENEKEMMFVIC